MTSSGPKRFGSVLPPLVLILALTGGCESKEKTAAKRAEQERLRELHIRLELPKPKAR